ncbi:ABC transporter permease [Flavisolibacter sp. BT320]|nr:ABC transporter permease [Flavisolibacter longurius]
MSAIFVDEPLAGGYFSNAPYMVTKVSLITFFFLGPLTLASFAGNAAARDFETRMDSLLYAAPIPRHVYLGGRFLAAFLLGSFVMMAVPIGVLAAAFFPLQHAELVGPLHPAAYLSTYFLLLLPNTFIIVAFMFAVAILNRRGMLSYLVTIIVAVVVIASWQLLGQQEGNWVWANLTDPLGLSIIMEVKPGWSANQKNTLLPGMLRSTLLNRALWLTLSAAILLLTNVRFKTATISTKDKKAVKRGKEVETLAFENIQVYQTAEITIPHVSKRFDLSTHLQQLSTITKESFKLIAYGWGWKAVACMFLFVVLTGTMWFSDYYDIPELPVTGNLLATLENVKDHGVWLIIPMLIIYYAGALVWRERDARLNDIIGAAPVPVWVSFAGKFAGMLLALMVMQLFLMIAGILLQVRLGYYNFQIPVYIKILFGLRLADYVLLAVLAFALHVIINQKYLANLIAVLFYLFTLFGPDLGIESGLLLYGSDPGWSYSDLRGLSPFMLPWLYFKMYWGAWAVLLVVLTMLLWPWGTENGFLKRWQQGIRKSNPSLKLFAGISVLMILVLGGFIHYNTHVLYPQTGALEALEWKAAYEKKYGKYSDRPQPIITRVKLQVDIYPDEGTAAFKGMYVLVNKTGVKIDTLFLSTSPEVEHHTLGWSRSLKSQVVDEELDFRMYLLENPILPGDSLQLAFYVSYDPKGFPNNGMPTTVVKNGTYFDDSWLPAIGYLNSRQIFNANDRKAQGLQPKSFLESDVVSYAQQRVAFEAIVGTEKGQTAVAPGRLVKSWTEKDRSYYHYMTENGVNYKLAFFSSAYDVHKAQYKPDSGQVVAISLLHHPEHTHNLDRMIRGVQASFNYLTGTFGKYPHSEIRFTEVPGYNKGLHAYPTTIFYREGFAHLKPEEDPRGIDIVFATIAHEVSHQWWGHQVSPAPIKGAALITESLAWFSAFEIVEEALGKVAFQTLIDLARDDYFSPQERDADPLLQASQTSLIYRKGPLALYALREYIGKEKVRLGLQNFFRKYSAVPTARPVPSDLNRELHAVTPDSMKYLLHDLFAANTFWDLKPVSVIASEIGGGKWKVKLDVKARKYIVDKKGAETDIPMNDWIQVGVYGQPGETKAGKSLYMQHHQIRSEVQRIEIEVTGKPALAGIDPNTLLMDVVNYDNVTGVQIQPHK